MPLYALGEHEPLLPDGGNYWLAPDANLIGNVVIHSGASVWFGSTLRGDNEQIIVGQGSNVQENSILHTDIGFPLKIGSNCTIGHRAMLHGCTIGDQSLIGMGATILNGACIGRECLIGAGALITENQIVPDGALVLGMPGKVVRQLDKAQRDALRESAIGYQKNFKRFKVELTVVDVD